jgi:ABC-type uncharacterized transport system YnjBCD substrate-binding protein
MAYKTNKQSIGERLQANRAARQQLQSKLQARGAEGVQDLYPDVYGDWAEILPDYPEVAHELDEDVDGPAESR